VVGVAVDGAVAAGTVTAVPTTKIGLFALEWGGRYWRRFGFDAIAQGLLHPGYSVSKPG
jgi:hypothetical protein